MGHVKIINPRSSFAGKIGKVVGKYRGDIIVQVDGFEMRFQPSEVEFVEAAA